MQWRKYSTTRFVEWWTSRTRRLTGLRPDGPNTKVPWAALGRNRSEFIGPEYWPKKIPVQDPSGINKAELDSILNHWQDRVDKDLEPFQFRDSEPPDNSEDDEKKPRSKGKSVKAPQNARITAANEESDETQRGKPSGAKGRKTGNNTKKNPLNGAGHSKDKEQEQEDDDEEWVGHQSRSLKPS